MVDKTQLKKIREAFDQIAVGLEERAKYMEALGVYLSEHGQAGSQTRYWKGLFDSQFKTRFKEFSKYAVAVIKVLYKTVEKYGPDMIKTDEEANGLYRAITGAKGPLINCTTRLGRVLNTTNQLIKPDNADILPIMRVVKAIGRNPEYNKLISGQMPDQDTPAMPKSSYGKQQLAKFADTGYFQESEDWSYLEPNKDKMIDSLKDFAKKEVEAIKQGNKSGVKKANFKYSDLPGTVKRIVDDFKVVLEAVATQKHIRIDFLNAKTKQTNTLINILNKEMGSEPEGPSSGFRVVMNNFKEWFAKTAGILKTE